MPVEFTTSYLKDALAVFRQYKKLAEGAMAQVSDEELTTVLDGEMNSIALVVKHMAGNMRSRWTDFLTTDGEKPDRNRDSEFVDPPATRATLMESWEDGWSRVWSALRLRGRSSGTRIGCGASADACSGFMPPARSNRRARPERRGFG